MLDNRQDVREITKKKKKTGNTNTNNRSWVQMKKIIKSNW